MKRQLILTALVVGTLGLNSTVFATDTEKASTPQDPPAKTVTPHSHVQDKHGIVQGAPSDISTERVGAVSPANDRSKHFHPRDR